MKILKIDGESSLINGNEFDKFKRDKGIIIKVSAPNVHEQHGRAERSEGVLTSRAIKLKLASNLPDHV